MNDAAESGWFDISYLARGNARQQWAHRTLHALEIFDVLRLYVPVLTGTVPLGVDIEGSDLDIVCEAYDLDAFERAVGGAFASRDGFRIERMTVDGIPTVFAKFTFGGFTIEVFGQPRAVTEQNAYRHMLIEERLLAIGGEDARREIQKLKRGGLKTEPAFACYFVISGDPYEALLELSSLEEEEVRRRIGWR